MADYIASDSEFAAVADAIRTKGGTSSSLEWPTGFASAISALPSGGGMNVQAYHGSDYTQTTSYTATDVTLTVKVTGTYKVSWTGTRSSTGGTSGSQLYINGTAYGSAQTTFGMTNYSQCINLTGVSLTKNDVLVVRARARGTSYQMHVANLVIEQTA